MDEDGQRGAVFSIADFNMNSFLDIPTEGNGCKNKATSTLKQNAHETGRRQLHLNAILTFNGQLSVQMWYVVCHTSCFSAKHLEHVSACSIAWSSLHNPPTIRSNVSRYDALYMTIKNNFYSISYM